MKKLYLLRHAEADAGLPMGNDHTRILTAEGRNQARALRIFLDKNGGDPELALTSDAARTLETASIAAIGSVNKMPALYLASKEDLLTVIQSTDDSVSSLMIIAHNPSIAELAYSFDDREIFSFRPCTLAIYNTTADSWALISPANTKLENIFSP